MKITFGDSSLDGKFVRLRSGEKAKVYEGGPHNQVFYHGAYLLGAGWVTTTWFPDGRHRNEGYSPLDIVARWVDKPQFDWSVIPPWFNYAAIDAKGRAEAFSRRPVVDGDTWNEWSWGIFEPSTPMDILQLPKSNTPAFSGNWKDSLCVRPGHGKSGGDY